MNRLRYGNTIGFIRHQKRDETYRPRIGVVPALTTSYIDAPRHLSIEDAAVAIGHREVADSIRGED